MRDFDSGRAERAEREQGFRLGGEDFRLNPGVHPSVLADYEDAIFSGREEATGAMDTVIKAFLWNQEARTRWDALRAREKDPVTVGDLRAVVQYLYEVESELPTIAPEPSSPGRASTSKPSAGKQSSRAATDS